MSEAMFHRLVDELVAKGTPWPRAIEIVAEDAKDHEDPFIVARRKALDKQGRAE